MGEYDNKEQIVLILVVLFSRTFLKATVNEGVTSVCQTFGTQVDKCAH